MRKTVIAIFLALVTCLTSCAGWQKWSTSFAACEKVDLGQQITGLPGTLLADLENLKIPPTTGLLEMISGIISANGPALEDDLAQIILLAGVDAVDCAVAAIEAVAHGSSGSASGSGAGSSAAPMPTNATRAPTGVERARAYVNAVRAASK